MRTVVQRVKKASVSVNDKIVGEIDSGLLVFLGVGKEDTVEDLEYINEKLLNLRIFEDDEQKMNKSVSELKLDILLVSQFTLYGDVRKGRRPSFSSSASPDVALDYYERLLESLKGNSSIGKVSSGEFGANMQVDLVNDGPVTILIDSKKDF